MAELAVGSDDAAISGAPVDDAHAAFRPFEPLQKHGQACSNAVCACDNGCSHGDTGSGAVGVHEPLSLFDPAGFCADEASFNDLGANEIKYGRPAMFGALGLFAQSLLQKVIGAAPSLKGAL